MSEVRPVRIEASWISIGLRRVPGWTRPGSLIALVAAGLMTGACTSGRSPPSAAVPARRILPVGASIGPGGYATILTAPPKPYPDAPPPPERPYGDDVEALARTLGISREEAMTRMNPDEPTLRAATSLAQRLRVEARAQFVEFKIERDPQPQLVFYFRKDAAATLARFTSDPRFRARTGGVPEAELQPLFDLWFERLRKYRLAESGELRALEGDVLINLGVSEAEYRTVAAREGWQVPSRVKLGFAPPLTQAVAPALAPLVRVFARADRSPDIILTTATYGTVVLRDGCFRIGTAPGAPLVLFGRNMALGLDDAGYMEVRSSADPEQRGRVGERFVWGGYPPAIESEPDVKVLRARCGVAPIVSIGEPQSARAFRARANVIDAYATAKRITRQAAWEEIKACWAREDAWVARRRSSSARPQQRQCDQAEID